MSGAVSLCEQSRLCYALTPGLSKIVGNPCLTLDFTGGIELPSRFQAPAATTGFGCTT